MFKEQVLLKEYLQKEAKKERLTLGSYVRRRIFQGYDNE
jgi:hypothetical protein